METEPLSDRVAGALAAFGHASLRPGQRQAVDAFLAGRDVQVLLPTGGGKSLGYQLPAVVLAAEGAGPTLVVSPLLSLMDDQVTRLRALGIAATSLHSGTPYRERAAVLDRLSDHALVYVSPERWKSARFRAAVGRIGVARVVVDEAHCISEWGHDFRPDYASLGEVKAALGCPVMAATATATPRVMDEIRESLGLVDPVVVRTPFRRDNLALRVEHHRGDVARTARLVALLDEAGLGRDPAAGRAVVYVATRARTLSVAKALRARKIRAAHYHAGRTGGARTKAQADFADGRAPVIVATTAFGMGIDHPDVRLVVHAQAPATLEAYAQQAGRAGRDGAPSTCALLYAPGDALTHARLRGDAPFPGAVEGWRALQDFVFGSACRMQVLARHFGDDPADAPPCGRCDVCVDARAVQTRVAEVRTERAAARQAKDDKAARDLAVELDEAQVASVLAFVDGLRRPVGKRLVASGLRGGRAKRAVRLKLPDNPAFGALRGVPEAAIVAAIEDMLRDGRLARKGKKYPTVWMPGKPVRAGGSATPDDGGPRRRRGRDTGLRGALRDLRRKEARRRRWKPYQVFPNATLDAIVASRPDTVAALLALPGMGPARIEKFSAPILALVARHPE